MHFKNLLLCSALLAGTSLSANAQTFIPPNMDFEAGTTANWTFYRGAVALNHVFTLASSGPVSGLHTLTSSSGTDMYGGFPEVGYGAHSLKLAHDTTDNNADGASYNVHVPVGGTYNLDYYYAAVLEGITHAPSEQPILKVTASDSVTGTVLSDSLVVLPSSPGFTLSTAGTDVYYKPWTAASIDLTGYGGHTVTVKIIVASCGTGAHFGYGYIDMNAVTMTSSSSTSVAAVEKEAFNIFPNPTAGTLNFQWTNQQTGSAEMEIRDLTGRMISKSVLKMNAASGTAQMNLGSLDDGTYLVAIKSASLYYSGRIVIQK